MSDVTAKVRAVVEGADPARQVVAACTVLIRVTPEVYEDCHTTLKTGTPSPIEPTSPNLERLGVHDGPHVAEPGLRTTNYQPPMLPTLDRQGEHLWAAYMTKLNICQAILRPAWTMPKPAIDRTAICLLERLKHHGETWHTMGQRAQDFHPVLEDTAHTLCSLVETDLAGWTTPRRVGVNVCHNAGLHPRCKTSPIYAKGLCRACYMRWYREKTPAHKEAA